MIYVNNENISIVKVGGSTILLKTILCDKITAVIHFLARKDCY